MERELKCKYCERYLGKSYGTIVAELKCSNSSCRATTHIKVINSDTVSDIRHKFLHPETEPKKKEVEVS
jgi:hypothetical protein